MGEVWRAHDTRLERDVALKTLPDQFAADAASIARLAREARLLATLNHPNIAAILGFEEQDGRCWLVLELVEGVTLEDRLAAGKLSLAEAADIALQVAEALQAAHSRGIIHCDLKPSNIKLTVEGRVKVLDFGISRSLQAPPQTLQTTRTAPATPGEMAGTPAYMSPEQTRGEQVGPTSDIWAFGVLLYRLLAGRLPFVGPTQADTAAQVLQSAPDLSPLRPQVPEGVIRLLARCLEKEPRRRVQHAGDLRFIIEEALLLKSTLASELVDWHADPQRPAAPRVPWLAVATLSAAAMVVGGLLWYFTGSTRSPAPASQQRARMDASLAVLPFVNISADPEQEYFSDGLTEELINQLARIEGLSVTARTSAFFFKGKTEDLRTVGKTLGVAHILEGSVRKAGGRIRITAQLINTTTGYHVWTETFDRSMDDVFAIQDEIATAVVGKLRPALGIKQLAADYGGTRSLDAYDHLLRGNAELNKSSSEAIQAAISEYRIALSIDPAYGRASAWLAIALSQRGPGATGAQAFDREREQAIASALKHAPNAPISHAAKMWLLSDRHKWVEADEACNTVFEIGGDPRAEGICGGFLTVTGRFTAAIPYRDASRRSDPLALVVASTMVRQYVLLNKRRELQAEFDRLHGLAGARWLADEAMLVYLAHNRAPHAQIEAQFASACGAVPTTAACAVWEAAIRSPEQAPARLRSLMRSHNETTSPFHGTIALAAAYLGDTSLAVEALERLTSTSASAAFQYLWFPLLGDVRKDARFKRIVSDIGLVDLWRQRGEWADFCRPRGPTDFECY
ncbi:MAG: protein kinase [Steroidobacteraceae bacterium]